MAIQPGLPAAGTCTDTAAPIDSATSQEDEDLSAPSERNEWSNQTGSRAPLSGRTSGQPASVDNRGVSIGCGLRAASERGRQRPKRAIRAERAWRARQSNRIARAAVWTTRQWRRWTRPGRTSVPETESLVVDASVMVDLLARSSLARAVGNRLRGSAWHAPAHLDAEVLSALGRLERAGRLDGVEAADGLLALSKLPIERHAVSPLLLGAWTLRNGVAPGRLPLCRARPAAGPATDHD